jgi:hypothetical protein
LHACAHNREFWNSCRIVNGFLFRNHLSARGRCILNFDPCLISIC